MKEPWQNKCFCISNSWSIHTWTTSSNTVFIALMLVFWSPLKTLKFYYLNYLGQGPFFFFFLCSTFKLRQLSSGAYEISIFHILGTSLCQAFECLSICEYLIVDLISNFQVTCEFEDFCYSFNIRRLFSFFFFFAFVELCTLNTSLLLNLLVHFFFTAFHFSYFIMYFVEQKTFKVESKFINFLLCLCLP